MNLCVTGRLGVSLFLVLLCACADAPARDSEKPEIVVASKGGKVSVDLRERAELFSLEWLNARTGAREGQAHLQGGAIRVLQTPDANDWVLHLRALRAATPETGPLSWIVPEEGGTPRDPKRLLPLGPREFMILAAAEEPESFLRHAVSRVDLICRNASRAEESVTVHLDLSGNGAREKLDPDGMGFGGMPRRNYVYIQAPGRPWKRIDGTVRGWVCTVTIPLGPGDTRLGLSPWYSYSDYLHYVDSLPQHPHLQKAVAGKSDGGRAIWELTITDPSVPAEGKRRIFWHTREHAYETFGSFAMEGLVAWLLSDAAADWRKQYVVSIHPMTNVDGVAMGYEYRGSYDHPKPRQTATAQATFGAMDRLKPHLTVTWHNWVAPRDVDVVFFTDDEGGKASRRAWDLFTQRFPSPRAVGHRWSNETDPLKHNYFGRKLTEDNVHQYAMKRYGTQVWGWEMPWWNRDEGDPAEQARRHGADFGRAFFDVQKLLRAGSAAAASESSFVEVPLGVAHEFSVRGHAHVDPRRAAVIAEFVSPSGKRREAVGVFERDAWRLSFTPDEAGDWSFLLRGEGVEHFSRGKLRCAPRP